MPDHIDRTIAHSRPNRARSVIMFGAMTRTSIALAGVALLAVVALAGCGGATVTEGPVLPSPSAGVAASDMVVTRTGGIAGFRDVVDIAADGTARVTTKNGETRSCTPSPAALDHLRAIDLGAVGSGPSKIADGFSYEVRSANGTASAGDGENTNIRAAFVAAAAEVVSSCLASAIGSGPPEQ
jgi:hypothetical protein